MKTKKIALEKSLYILEGTFKNEVRYSMSNNNQITKVVEQGVTGYG